MRRKESPGQKYEDMWGVPDWRNADEYPAVKDLDETYWRWEFLRRDSHYREEWKKYRADKSAFRIALEGDADGGSDLPYYPEEHEDKWSDIWRFLRKYGLARLLDPTVARPTHLMFHFVPFAPDPEDNPLLHGINVNGVPWMLQFPYLAWFNLWEPIGRQIEHYAALLVRAQAIAFELLEKRSDGGGKKKKSYMEAELAAIMATVTGSPCPPFRPSPVRRDKRPEKDQYPAWLRVLDARGKGASWGTIGKNILKQSYDAPAHARNAFKAAQNVWWKIPVERSIGPAIGAEENDWHETFSVLPPPQGEKPILHDWFDKLPPRLSKLMFASLH